MFEFKDLNSLHQYLTLKVQILISNCNFQQKLEQLLLRNTRKEISQSGSKV